MCQRPIIREKNKNWAIESIEGLNALVSTVRVSNPCYSQDLAKISIDRVLSRFPDDYNRVEEIADLLSGADIAGYGDRASAVFIRWNKNGPSLSALLAWALENFHLNVEKSNIHAALMAGILADIPNELLYHGNSHYQKVLIHTIRLIATHRSERFSDYPALGDDDVLKLLIAATIHDLGHEGGDNLRDGIYTPGYMEQKAFDMVRPYFEALDVPRDMRSEIETMIFCTDITFFAGENSPCVRMKKIYRHFFAGGLPEGEDAESMMIGKLRLFENNPKLALMAMMLHEADIATSAGLTYEQSKAETISIMEERGIQNAGPKILLRFLADQLDGRMMTPAAQCMFSKAMETIMKQANDDIAAGIEIYGT